MKKASTSISLFENLYKYVSDCIAVVDVDCNIVYCNKAFKLFYDVSEGQKIDLPFLPSNIDIVINKKEHERFINHTYHDKMVNSVISLVNEEKEDLVLFLTKTLSNEASFESEVNESLAKASTELISPSLSIDTIARIVFKACLELTNSKIGFVAFDDPMSENILIHYFSEAYIGSRELVGNIKFIDRDDYLQKGLLGYEINANKPFFKNDLELKVLKKIVKNDPSIIRNYLTYPAIVDNVFMGQVVLFNSPNGFNQKHLDIICSLSNVYGLAIFRQRMEWDLVSAKEKAEESDRLKTAFLANMSHEIRTPMNAIVGFSQLITTTEYDSQKRVEFSKLIHSSCDDLLKLVTQIIDLSKMESKQMILYPESFNLEQVLCQQIEIIKAKVHAKSKNIDVSFCSNSPNLMITADKGRISQIIENLLDNAFKFTESGNISLFYELTEPNLINITIKDSGIGIPYEKQKHIFESFQQLEVAMKRNFGGTGLGLTIVKNLAELMGGKIILKSKPDSGSEFKISIPIYQFSTFGNGHVTKESRKSQLYLYNKLVLIVEDEPRNAKFLELLLKGEKAHTKIMYNGKQAVEWTKLNTPHLILMDLRMPVMDGIEATKIIKKMLPDVPIIAQTAYAMKEDETLCLEAGCDAFIAKPVKKEALLNIIKEKLN